MPHYLITHIGKHVSAGDASEALMGGGIADASRTPQSLHSFLPSQAMAPRPQSSAAGVLALLSEPEPLLKEHALKALNALVPQFWAEISEHIELMWVLTLSFYGSAT